MASSAGGLARITPAALTMVKRFKMRVRNTALAREEIHDQGPRAGIHPGELGAAFFLPTAIVPPLLVTHFLIFQFPTRPKGS